ncbi:MAG: hypothetical protein R3Y28_07085 [Candidatus Gastranaerophilales bacterium]
MDEITKLEKIFYISLFALIIFILGVQIGIARGRTLEKQGYYDYVYAN